MTTIPQRTPPGMLLASHRPQKPSLPARENSAKKNGNLPEFISRAAFKAPAVKFPRLHGAVHSLVIPTAGTIVAKEQELQYFWRRREASLYVSPPL